MCQKSFGLAKAFRNLSFPLRLGSFFPMAFSSKLSLRRCLLSAQCSEYCLCHLNHCVTGQASYSFASWELLITYLVIMQGIRGIPGPSAISRCIIVGRILQCKVSHTCAAPRAYSSAAASARGQYPTGSQTALKGAAALQLMAPQHTRIPGRRGADIVVCQTTEGDNYIDLPEPSRRSVSHSPLKA